MAMLSRVAENIFWIGRYVERAENTARLLDVALRSSREMASLSEPDAGAEGPRVALRATASLDAYERRYGSITEDGIASFLAVDPDNPSSVVSCLTLARGNARSVRDAISSEMWEELNRTYLAFRRVTTAYLLIDGLNDFAWEVRRASQTFQGVSAATMPRDEGWHFLQAGMYLERAAMTARILEAEAPLLSIVPGRTNPEHVHRWLSLLRSVSGYEAYMRLVPGGVQPLLVAAFLLFDLAFPRSVAFGVRRIVEELAAIDAGLGIQQDDGPVGTAAALAARLQTSDRGDLLGDGLNELVLVTERECNAIGVAVRQAYLENRHHAIFRQAALAAAPSG
jgi:uncharacterized alpha-E superfamily protein